MKVGIALFCVLLGLASGAAADVSHVVFSWFKADAGQARIDAALAASTDLQQIPGVIEVRSGSAVASDRPIVDDSFDIGITMRFDSVAAMQAYVLNPAHVHYVDTYIKPFAERILVYDILEQ